MDNDNRTPKDAAIEHRAKGILNQVKGSAKEAWGNLTDNPKAKAEGKIDRLKGRVQEGFGNLIDPDKTNDKL
ncbi:MAG: hypothetical protein NVSMB68_08200 [Thermoanaerobaculia bacterium]